MGHLTSRWTDDRIFATGMVAFCLFYLALALTGVFRLPLLEGPDESDHFRYVLILRDLQVMPLLPRYVPPGEEARAGEQAQHPPLYYALLAAVSLVFTDPTTPTAIHTLKLVGVLCGLGALLATAACARRLWPEEEFTALGAVGALAFLPLLWMMTAVLNNSAATVLAGALGLLLLQNALYAATTRARDWLGVGLTVSLGMMAKITAIWMLPVIAVVMWARWRREGAWRIWPRMLLPVVLPLALFVGVWLYYNFSHFGVLMPERVLGRRYLPGGFATIFFMPLAAQVLLHTAVFAIPASLMAPYWLMRSYIGFPAAATLMIVYFLPSLFAFLLSGRRRWSAFCARPQPRETFLAACLVGGLAAWFISIQAVLHDWNTGLYAGRYALDAAPAIAIVWAAGMRVLLPHWRARIVGLTLWLGGLLYCAWWTLMYMLLFYHV